MTSVRLAANSFVHDAQICQRYTTFKELHNASTDDIPAVLESVVRKSSLADNEINTVVQAILCVQQTMKTNNETIS